jgi:hypothetical protein
VDTFHGETVTVTFEPNNRSAGTVDTDNGQYAFAYDTSGAITVTYPDGSVYSQREMNGATAVYDDDDAAEAKGYLAGYDIVWAIEDAIDQDRNDSASDGSSPLIAVVLLLLGVWNLFAPKSVWWLGHGWAYRNAEPSDLALTMYRLGGVVLIILGVLCLLGAI